MATMSVKKQVRINSNDFCNTLYKAHRYNRMVLYHKINTPEKFNKLYHYTTEDYNRDLNILQNFDSNLIWKKEFWGLVTGDCNSICAIASEPSQKFSNIMKFHRENLVVSI
jgi:hypothetical protein